MSYHHYNSHPDGDGVYFPPHPHSAPPPLPPHPQDHPYPTYSPFNGRQDNGGYFYSSPVWSKPGYNRKDSADSGISDYSSGWSSRKTSTNSNSSLADYSNGRKMSTVSNFSVSSEYPNNRKDSSNSSYCPEYSNCRKLSANSNSGFGEYPPGRKHSFNSSSYDDYALEDIKEETPFEVPDEELCVQIVQQVEFYFSDANISKDKFLLKHVKRNKEGFVSIKLISSFKRVKHLTRDWRQVAFAIEAQSHKLEVNDQKTKVRRLDPLPDYDETTPSRTIAALDLPLERPTIEAVAELFSGYGEIVLVRILRPGNPIPADVKPLANKHPEMAEKVCALVEFECPEQAMKAVQDLQDQMKVMELTTSNGVTKAAKKEEKKKGAKLYQPLQVPNALGPVPAAPVRRVSHAGFGHQHQQQEQPNMFAPNKGRRISLQHNMTLEEQVPQSALNPNAPTFQMQQRGRSAFSVPQHSNESSSNSSSQCSWMMRRMSFGSSSNRSCGLTLPPNVIRMPRGPEKGKAFIRKVRAKTSIAAEDRANVPDDVKITVPDEGKVEPEIKVPAEVKAKASMDEEKQPDADVEEKSR